MKLSLLGSLLLLVLSAQSFADTIKDPQGNLNPMRRIFF